MSDSIKVAVRVRPFLPREEGETCIVKMPDRSTTIIVDPKTNESREFVFDHSYWSHEEGSAKSPFFATQESVYEELGRDILTNAGDGYNGCLFAYGQTGAGKSHSVLGTPSEPGILPRVCQGLFEMIEDGKKNKERSEYLVEVSFLEIYNERLRDLAAREPKDHLDLRQSPQQGVFIPGLDRIPVSSIKDIDAVLDFGMRARTVAATNMNAVSSRSHAVFTIHFKQKFLSPESNKMVQRSSQIHLVDLAGSERASKTQATGARLKEGSMINQSLSALGIVISKLAQNAALKAEGKASQFVPFRNSKLTHLLSDALAGNTKTVMVAAISPAASNFDESLSTLRFARMCKSVVTSAKRNEETDEKMVGALKEEINRLRFLLDQANATQALNYAMMNNTNTNIPDNISQESTNREKTADFTTAVAAEAETSRLLGELADVQSLMDYYKTSWQDLQRRSEQEATVRVSNMISPSSPESSTTTSTFHAMLDKVEEFKGKYLVNVSDDSQLEGRLKYRVGHSSLVTFGSAPESDNAIEGLGIYPYMFDVSSMDDSSPSKKKRKTIKERCETADDVLKSDAVHYSTSIKLFGVNDFAVYNDSLSENEQSGQVVYCSPPHCLRIRAAYPQCRVLVNNLIIPADNWTEIRHNDVLSIGRSLQLRVVDYDEVKDIKALSNDIQSKISKAQAASLKYNSIIGTGGEDALLSELRQIFRNSELSDEETSSVVTFMLDIEKKVGSLRAKQFFKQFKNSIQLVEEANEITRTVRPRTRLRFSVEALAPIVTSAADTDTPEIVVRMWRDQRAVDKWRAAVRRMLSPKIATAMMRIADPTVRSYHKASIPITVWDFPKFLDRLEAMRGEYQDWVDAQRKMKKPLIPNTKVLLEREDRLADVTNPSVGNVPLHIAPLQALADPWKDVSVEEIESVVSSCDSVTNERIRQVTSLLTAKLKARDEEIRLLKAQLTTLQMPGKNSFSTTVSMSADTKKNDGPDVDVMPGKSERNSAFGAARSSTSNSKSRADFLAEIQNLKMSSSAVHSGEHVQDGNVLSARHSPQQSNVDASCTGSQSANGNSGIVSQNSSPSKKLDSKGDLKNTANKFESMLEDLGSIYAKWDQMNGTQKK
eukprot:GDKJ01000089.1.p1 GENE.GDKJ01000089.1~~GDKJ01000089.1.p1  ORF type:complete len:1113 (-),score=274.05 GDKJ01000089.1:137-3475(-)